MKLVLLEGVSHTLTLSEALRVPGERSETRDTGPNSRLHSLSPLDPGSRSGYASASAGTRKTCDAVQVLDQAGIQGRGPGFQWRSESSLHRSAAIEANLTGGCGSAGPAGKLTVILMCFWALLVDRSQPS